MVGQLLAKRAFSGAFGADDNDLFEGHGANVMNTSYELRAMSYELDRNPQRNSCIIKMNLDMAFFWLTAHSSRLIAAVSLHGLTLPLNSKRNHDSKHHASSR
jgi:hypothetical protein